MGTVCEGGEVVIVGGSAEFAGAGGCIDFEAYRSRCPRLAFGVGDEGVGLEVA